MEMKAISVIIPVYNGRDTIEKCLLSVLDNDYEEFEVIVVDDSSTDGTTEVLRSIKHERLKLFVNVINSGASFSRNFGIKKSSGDIVLLLDSDSYVDKGWIKRHACAHNNIDADIIGGGIVGIHETIFGRCDGFCNWWTSIPYSRSHYVKKLHIPTNNISIKKDVFRKIGHFREELRLGGEDAEFCSRALKNGVKIYFMSDLIAYHYDRDDYEGYIKHQENWGRHAVRMRKGMKMEYSYLMPDSYIKAWFYILPLAILYTAFIVAKWVRYKPSVLIFSPLIFLGKIRQTAVIKDSFKTS